LLDLTNAPEGFLDPVARVVEAALAVTEGLSAREVMVVGAGCRDILHSALGHSFATAATRDLDLALAPGHVHSRRMRPRGRQGEHRVPVG